MKTRKRNNKKIRKTKHKKKRKTMRIKVIKKKYNKTRKMKGGENRKTTQKRRLQEKINFLNNEIGKLQKKVDAKNTILTIIKQQRKRKIKEINELKNELNKSGNEKKFCQGLIEKIQKLKIIRGDETTELADGMYQIMKTGQIIIPHETNKEDQKDVWIKLDFGEQSLKSTPSAMEKNIQTNHTIHSLSDMIDFSNKTTIKDSFIEKLNEALINNTTDSMRDEEEKKEQKKINNMRDQIKKFKNERKLRPASAPAQARQSAASRSTSRSAKRSAKRSAPAAPAKRSAPKAPIIAWNKKSDK